MKNFFIELLDWIYKKRCYCCASSKEAVPICSKCYNELEFNPPQADRIIEGVDIFVAGVYEKNLQKLPGASTRRAPQKIKKTDKNNPTDSSSVIINMT